MNEQGASCQSQWTDPGGTTQSQSPTPPADFHFDISTMINSDVAKPPRPLCAFCHCDHNDDLAMFDASISDQVSRLSLPAAAATAESALKAFCQRRLNTTLDESIFTCKELAGLGWTRIDDFHLAVDASHVWAHRSCLKWTLGEADRVANVDKVVIDAVGTKCDICLTYGASVPCAFAACAKRFHLACAAITGAFLHYKSFRLLCHDHIEQASVLCKSFIF